ncbi:MAG: DNA methyltransferase [Candidatus Poribacteria bacterium]|nr:DNA methyltransferase [Candidatus Poribacteria bacterium]
MKIKPVKGRPMLHWVGKRPIDTISNYPAQLVETYDVEKPEKEPTYDRFKEGPNLLFHGDNKEILSTLLVQGFRGKIDLIYIDPPFASGADYVREVALRGKREKLEAEGHTIAEQIQYSDIWANDTYLQFMYERLTLMRELLSDNGSIFVHCDWRMNSYLRLVLDEIFGEFNFRNEIVWRKYGGHKNTAKLKFTTENDTLLFYSLTDRYTFNAIFRPLSEQTIKSEYRHTDENGRRYAIPRGRKYLQGTVKRVYLDTNPGVAIGTYRISNPKT